MGGDAEGVLRDQQPSLGAFKEVALANRRPFPQLRACEWGAGAAWLRAEERLSLPPAPPLLHPQLSHPSEGY